MDCQQALLFTLVLLSYHSIGCKLFSYCNYKWLADRGLGVAGEEKMVKNSNTPALIR